jgi:AAA domain/Helix-turn-helix domain
MSSMKQQPSSPLPSVSDPLKHESFKDMVRKIDDPVVPKAPDGDLYAKHYNPVGLSKFLEIDMPKRGCLLPPWLSEQGLSVIYADRGVGKTFLCLSVAYAVATGGECLGWKAPSAKRVLYIDGEMTAFEMSERLKLIVPDNKRRDDPPFVLLTPDAQDIAMPDLQEWYAQQRIKYLADHADLIVVDNIATLCRSGSENSADSWKKVQSWALKLKSQGKSVLFCHHAGRNGKMRGTSFREGVMDSIIFLERPSGYVPQEGAKFTVNFEKSRNFYGAEAASFEASLETDATGNLCWVKREAPENKLSKVIRLIKEGHSQNEIADLLGVHKSTISRDVKKLRERGQYPDLTATNNEGTESVGDTGETSCPDEGMEGGGQNQPLYEATGDVSDEFAGEISAALAEGLDQPVIEFDGELSDEHADEVFAALADELHQPSDEVSDEFAGEISAALAEGLDQPVIEFDSEPSDEHAKEVFAALADGLYEN